MTPTTKERLPGVLASQRSDCLFVVVLEVTLRSEHEADSEGAARRGTQPAVTDARQRKAQLAASITPAATAFDAPSTGTAAKACDEEWKRPKPGRQ